MTEGSDGARDAHTLSDHPSDSTGADHSDTQTSNPEDHHPVATDENGDPIKKKKKRRKRRRRKADGASAEHASTEAGAEDADSSGEGDSDAADPEASDAPREKSDKPEGEKKRKKRRKRKKSRDDDDRPAAPVDTDTDIDADADIDDSDEDEDEIDEAIVPKLRSIAQPPPVDATDPDLFDQDHSFAGLGITGEVLDGVTRAGFTKPTIIQSLLIPVALTGRDALGQAKTGTGKTAAFGLPLLQMAEPGKPFQALILAPTRELAIQIADGITELGKNTALRVVPVYGGQSIRVQADKLDRKPEIIVGTPGRIMDMIERGYMTLKYVRYAILDEVDRMLDIGFRDDIRRILGQCPTERQTIMVSATISPDIEELARRYMRSPEKIVTSSGSLTVKMVKQHYLTVNPWDKRRLLVHLLEHEEPALTLVFCRLKKTVDKLAETLERKNIDVHAMHGDMRQARRESVLKKLKKGRLGVLVASDLASRGLDVEGITHVINYDLPDDPEVYVHRIGRTARAGRDGIAWSFVTPEQGKVLSQIEDLINTEIPAMHYPDFEPSDQPENWRPEPTGGRPPVEVRGVPDKVARNRYAAMTPPKVKEDAPKQKVADFNAKFPGGIVPTKPPAKRMHGKVRTSRSNRLDD